MPLNMWGIKRREIPSTSSPLCTYCYHPISLHLPTFFCREVSIVKVENEVIAFERCKCDLFNLEKSNGYSGE